MRVGAFPVSIDIEPFAGATERETVESVQAGKADIGLVAARVFDTVGVTGMRALQAPFLIDRNAVADAVHYVLTAPAELNVDELRVSRS